MKRHLLTLWVLATTFLSILMAAAWVGASDCLARRNLCDLVRYQVGKLDGLPPRIDTLFLGDSSLGHALDAKLFGDLRGARALNLALTGWNFNLPSYHNMFLRVLERVEVRNMVLFMTPQDFDVTPPLREDPAFRGYIATLGHRNLSGLVRGLLDCPLPIAHRFVLSISDQGNLAAGLQALVGSAPPACANCGEADYLRQGAAVIHAGGEGFGPATNRYAPSLARFKEACRHHAVNCLYMNGAVYRPAAENSASMIKTINEQIEAAGFRVIQAAPIALERHEIGDSINHVKPEMKSMVTRRIHALLEPSLAKFSDPIP